MPVGLSVINEAWYIGFLLIRCPHDNDPMTRTRLHGLGPAAIQQVIATAQALEMGRPDEAAARIAPLLKSKPDHPEILRLHAGILDLRGKPDEAVRAMQAAIAQRPKDPLYHNTLGAVLGSAGDYKGAIAALRRASELQPSLATAWFNLGVMLTRSVRHAEAIKALRRTVALDPKHMDARALLADMLRVEDHAEQAAIEYRKIIAERPWTGMAWWGLADIKTLRFETDDIERMRSAIQDSRASDNDRIATGFALAKALDEQHREAESLDVLAHANRIARRRRRWNAPMFNAVVARGLDAFTPPPVPAADPALGHEAIFIVGLPRSGSTVVEQILASHSQVEGPGELSDLPWVLAEESRRRGKPFPDWVAEMQAPDWQRLGQRYLQRTANWRKQRPISTDKLPGNWLYIGVIRAMLPGARIIACRRDPLETCFSCYRQHLDGNDYTRTFEDVAAYWREYDGAIRHWRPLHRTHLYEHVYEKLLDNPEPNIRALLQFCGLAFEEACLSFHETVRDVRTPSAMQVRQPLRRDTARARRYGALLDPLRLALGMPPFDAQPCRT